jgi:uncharacterized membrane protein
MPSKFLVAISVITVFAIMSFMIFAFTGAIFVFIGIVFIVLFVAWLCGAKIKVSVDGVQVGYIRWTKYYSLEKQDDTNY